MCSFVSATRPDAQCLLESRGTEDSATEHPQLKASLNEEGFVTITTRDAALALATTADKENLLTSPLMWQELSPMAESQQFEIVVFSAGSFAMAPRGGSRKLLVEAGLDRPTADGPNRRFPVACIVESDASNFCEWKMCVV